MSGRAGRRDAQMRRRSGRPRPARGALATMPACRQPGLRTRCPRKILYGALVPHVVRPRHPLASRRGLPRLDRLAAGAAGAGPVGVGRRRRPWRSSAASVGAVVLPQAGLDGGAVRGRAVCESTAVRGLDSAIGRACRGRAGAHRRLDGVHQGRGGSRLALATGPAGRIAIAGAPGRTPGAVAARGLAHARVSAHESGVSG
ncbi:Uncharacterised protein [Bordetella trematum]|nr:Uncharacterised protein [Bordetella trematum]